MSDEGKLRMKYAYRKCSYQFILGLQRLYQAFKQCKISKLDVSYCGLTSKSAVTLAQWASEGTIKEMTITGNDLFPTEHQFSQFIEMYANSDTKVTLDFAEVNTNFIFVCKK